VYHDISVPAPYRWMEDLTAEETRTWVAAQNEITELYLDSLPEREVIRRLLTSLATQPRSGVPFRAGGRHFVLRRDGAQDQPVLYVQSALKAEPRVLLDVNRTEPSGTTALVQDPVVSPDGHLVAYGVTEAGSDWQVLRVRRVDTGEDLPDRIEGMRGWHWASCAADASGFFYPRQLPQDSDGMPREQLMYHRLGTPQADDQVVFDRPGEWPRARVSDDGRYVFVITALGNEPVNRVYYGDFWESNSTPGHVSLVPLIPTPDAAYQVIGNAGPVVFVATTLDAPKGRIIAVDMRNPERAHWRTVVPEGEYPLTVNFILPTIRIVDGRLVVPVSLGTHDVVRFYTLAGEPAGELPLPGFGSVSDIQGTPGSPELLYAFGRFPHPTTIFRYDLQTGETAAVFVPPMPFDPERYETYRVTYTSKDGTRVPMFITHRIGIVRDGSHPMYLTGYGGFGGTTGPAGDDRLRSTAWLELGGIVAVPSLRGGGDFGEEWHRAGMKERKQNVFDDFIAAAEHLIQEGYTRAEKLAIGGTSNGGLLVAATLVQRPDLFAAAIPDVALTDMLRYSRLPGGEIGIFEYGVPDTPESFRYLYAYSPLHRGQLGTCYPATLVTTGMNDENVHPSHSFKFAAALQTTLQTRTQTGRECGPVLLRTEADAGHGGGASAEARIENATDGLAFLVKHLEVPLSSGARSSGPTLR
jgi:prolyl oligopeptidase